MARVCEVCGKGKLYGSRITRRGKAKKEGGIGRHVVKVSARTQSPNLQRLRVLVDGVPKRLKVCTDCIKSGRIERAY
ncbi:MAG: 50S ribosomal protein L28 [Halanaerobiaceae bacterium]|nr:50S ribosomal protein L28 [Halanaerobiaceae bacterium]